MLRKEIPIDYKKYNISQYKEIHLEDYTAESLILTLQKIAVDCNTELNQITFNVSTQPEYGDYVCVLEVVWEGLETDEQYNRRIKAAERHNELAREERAAVYAQLKNEFGD